MDFPPRGCRHDGGEYRYACWRLERHGVACPRPDLLVRSAIIGVVEVVEIVTASENEWFGGTAGLLLKEPKPVNPIPAKGALGYFRWERSGDTAPVKPWMRRFAGKDPASPDLFPDAHLAYRSPPKKPWGGE